MNDLLENRLQKRNDHGTPSAETLIRRHTTPDMAASAAYGMVLCGTDELEHRYRGRIEKVKFGVPINEAFSHDIPATLLVLLLKVNKEGPLKKDIWRAPGNQAQVRKLSNIMQHGRLVNISNISVYTAASVIKRFLAKLPGGILGADNEKQLFDTAQQPNVEEEQRREIFCRIVSSLPLPSQHLLVLLFGTFRVITDSAETFGTRMTPDAIGISVAPSLFHTCIHDGQRAKLEDVLRFKMASKVISEIIHGFGYTNLFPRECYEFYARITGRTLRVDEQWRFSFQLPSNPKSAQAVGHAEMASRRSSRRSRRKSSTSSSTASALSQLQNVRALAASSKASSNTDLCNGIQMQPSIYRSASQRAATLNRTGSIQISNMMTSTGAIMTTPPSALHTQLEEREKRTSFSLLSPSVTTNQQASSCFPVGQAGEGWYVPVRQHLDRRSIPIGQFGPPPPPPTTALQRRIDAYCAAANINPKEEFQRSRSQHSRTLSQPSIRFERSQSPTGRRQTDSELELQQYPTTSAAAAAEAPSEEFCEDEDIYGESLPELGRYAPHSRRRDQSRSLDDPTKAAIEWKELVREREQRLSTSMGEVIVHSEEESEHYKPRDYLESTRSLTYLEWVHERQTKRMKTRSEWFLSPTMPPKNGASSREYYSRISQRFSASPVHLRLPKKEECALSSSGDEEMCSSSGMGCSRSGCAVTSADTSMKCSPRRPDSCCTSESIGDTHMKSQPATEESSDDDAFLTESQYSPTKIPRQPFQLLQERQYSTSTTEGSASAQVTPSAVEITHGKNGRQRFFGSGEQEGGLQALPELVETSSPQPRRFSAPFVEASPTSESAAPISAVAKQSEKQSQSGTATARSLIQTMSSGSSGSGSGSGASAQTVIGIPQSALEAQQTQQQQQQTRMVGTGVVRRRSWRTHYTRPKNKSLEYETGNEVAPSSQSTPLRSSPPAGGIFTRRHSSNGGGEQQQTAVIPATGIPERPGPSAGTREALIRRKSSGNGGSTKTKPPVQTRKSTQI